MKCIVKKLFELEKLLDKMVQRMEIGQAIDFEDLNRYNTLCYELFPDVQDGEEFREEKPEVTFRRKVDPEEAPPVKSIDFAGFRFTGVEGQENTVRIERLV